MSEKTNDKLQEAINEAVLKAAFREAAEQDIAELEAMDIEVPSPTEKQRKEVEKAIRIASRKQKRGSSRVWRAVAMFAIFFCVAASAIMIQPTVRASVWDFVVSFYEKYLSFDFDAEEANANFALGEYTICYVPTGYVWKESDTNPLKSKMFFSKGESVISITIYPTSVNNFNTDIEGDVSEQILVSDCEGYLISYKDRNLMEMVFGDDRHTIIIRGSLSSKELIKIAKNIK